MFWLATIGGFFIGASVGTLFWAFMLGVEEHFSKEIQKIKDNGDDHANKQ